MFNVLSTILVDKTNLFYLVNPLLRNVVLETLFNKVAGLKEHLRAAFLQKTSGGCFCFSDFYKIQKKILAASEDSIFLISK